MDRLVQRLISQRQTEMETPELIDLSQLVAQSEAMLKRAVAPGISLQLQPGSPRGAPIRARRWDLERMLLNLVINAARGMAAGGAVVIKTSSTLDASGGLSLPHAGVRPTVSLIVSSSGTAATSSARIVSRSASGQHENDLGLAAVARLVQRLNGVLQFESDSDRRTRIQVDLPMAIGDVQDDPA
jgi:signal transduction histidine kinase